MTAERLGRDVVKSPEFARAATELADAVASRGLETSVQNRIETFETVVIQRLRVSFDMSTAVVVRERDRLR